MFTFLMLELVQIFEDFVHTDMEWKTGQCWWEYVKEHKVSFWPQDVEIAMNDKSSLSVQKQYIPGGKLFSEWKGVTK